MVDALAQTLDVRLRDTRDQRQTRCGGSVRSRRLTLVAVPVVTLQTQRRQCRVDRRSSREPAHARRPGKDVLADQHELGGGAVTEEERRGYGACHIGRACAGECEAVGLAQVDGHLDVLVGSEREGVDPPPTSGLGGAGPSGGRPPSQGEALEAPKDVGQQRVGPVQPSGGCRGDATTPAGNTREREGIDRGGGQGGAHERP